MSSEQEREEKKTTPRSKIKSRAETENVPERRPTPASILVYVGVVVFTLFYGLIIPGEPALAVDQRLAITVFFRLMLVFLLVNRSFVGWIVAVIFEAMQIILVALLIEPPGGPKIWGMLFLHTAAMALLLTGATRQHVWRRSEERPPGPRTRAQIEEDEQRQRDATSSSSSSSSTGS
jgi:hypothetical protein